MDVKVGFMPNLWKQWKQSIFPLFSARPHVFMLQQPYSLRLKLKPAQFFGRCSQREAVSHVFQRSTWAKQKNKAKQSKTKKSTWQHTAGPVMFTEWESNPAAQLLHNPVGFRRSTRFGVNACTPLQAVLKIAQPNQCILDFNCTSHYQIILPLVYFSIPL